MKKVLFILFTLILASACSAPTAAPTATVPPRPTLTAIPTVVLTETPTATATAIFFDPEELADMTNEAKIAAVPPSKDGYSASNVSSVKDNIVIYRDDTGKAVQAFDLLTGETKSLELAGIIELDLTDGNKREMLAFYDEQELVKYLSTASQWQTGDRFAFMDNVLKSKASHEYVPELKKILGMTHKFAISNPWKSDDYVWMSLDSLELQGDTLVTFIDLAGNFNTLYVDANVNDLKKKLTTDQLVIPTPNP